MGRITVGTYLFDDGLQPGHSNDSDPHWHERPEKVTELQDVILHDAKDHNTRLVTCMVELSEEREKATVRQTTWKISGLAHFYHFWNWCFLSKINFLSNLMQESEALEGYIMSATIFMKHKYSVHSNLTEMCACMYVLGQHSTFAGWYRVQPGFCRSTLLSFATLAPPLQRRTASIEMNWKAVFFHAVGLNVLKFQSQECVSCHPPRPRGFTQTN